MPALSLICGEFIKSLLTPAESTVRHNAAAEETLSNGKLNGNGLLHAGSDAEEEEDEAEHEQTQQGEQQKEEVRKTLLAHNTALEEVSTQQEDSQLLLDARLQHIAQLEVQLEF